MSQDHPRIIRLWPTPFSQRLLRGSFPRCCSFASGILTCPRSSEKPCWHSGQSSARSRSPPRSTVLAILATLAILRDLVVPEMEIWDVAQSSRVWFLHVNMINICMLRHRLSLLFIQYSGFVDGFVIHQDWTLLSWATAGALGWTCWYQERQAQLMLIYRKSYVIATGRDSTRSVGWEALKSRPCETTSMPPCIRHNTTKERLTANVHLLLKSRYSKYI